MDKLIESIAPFGRFQKLVTALIGLVSSLTAMLVFSNVFITARPDLSCHLRVGGTIENVSIQVVMSQPVTSSQLVAAAAARTIINKSETCDIWAKIQSNKTIAMTHECTYDRTYYGLTIVNEWDLVCDRSIYASLSLSLFMCGALCSALFIGYASDRYGRKTVSISVLIAFCIQMLVSQSLQIKWFGLSNRMQFVVYSLSQIVLGVCGNGIFAVSYILLIELTTSEYSTIVSNINLYMYVFGELIIVLVAYFARDWHIINWFILVYAVVILIVCKLFLPESPRYLMQQKKYKQLLVELERIARINKTQKAFEQYDSSALISSSRAAERAEIRLTMHSGELLYEPSEPGIFKLIFKSKTQLLRTLLFGFVWFSISMTYYGVSLGITSVGNINPYLMYTLSSVSEFLGYSICHLNDKFGRKRLFVIYLGLASLMCLSVALIQLWFQPTSPLAASSSSLASFIDQPSKILLVLVALAGKGMASAAFNSAYVYTSQMYPTEVRNTLLMLVSSIGRIGSIISPQINLLGDLLLKQLPFLIFSFSSMIGCLFIVILPDPSKVPQL